MNYTYENANTLLMSAFPEMKEIYENDIDYDGLPYYQDGAYHFYETEFEQFIIKQLRSKNEAQLKKIFDFIEDIYENGDDELINLVGVAVVESMVFDKCHIEFSDLVFKYCGEKTRESFNDSINAYNIK